jgi:hypothetical protein
LPRKPRDGGLKFSGGNSRHTRRRGPPWPAQRELPVGADASFEFHHRRGELPLFCFFHRISTCFGTMMFLSNFVLIDSIFPRLFLGLNWLLNRTCSAFYLKKLAVLQFPCDGRQSVVGTDNYLHEL